MSDLDGFFRIMKNEAASPRFQSSIQICSSNLLLSDEVQIELVRMGAAMTDAVTLRIDASAAKELVHWKSLFAQEVCKEAMQIAAQRGNLNSVTLEHFRQAAGIALQSLTAAIRDGDADDVQRRAA